MDIDIILSNIISVFKENEKVSRVILFGSRGKGNARYNSDFDLAVDTEGIDFSSQIKIKEKIEDFCGLFNVDVIYMNEIDFKFKEIIEKTGKVIYVR